MYYKDAEKTSNNAENYDKGGEIIQNEREKAEEDVSIVNGGNDTESYQLYSNRLVITKKNKDTIIPIADIDSAKLSMGSVWIVKKDSKEIILSMLKKEELAEWINTINLYAKGENNFTPISQEEIKNKVKKYHRNILIIVLVVIAFILIVVNPFGGDKSSDNESNSDAVVYDANVPGGYYYSASVNDIISTLEKETGNTYTSVSVEDNAAYAYENQFGGMIVFMSALDTPSPERITAIKTFSVFGNNLKYNKGISKILYDNYGICDFVEEGEVNINGRAYFRCASYANNESSYQK